MSKRTTIYADYQATTPVDPRVIAKMEPYWTELFGNPHSSDHVIGWRANEAVVNAAESVANLIGASPSEIVFTSGATEANNLALLGLARRAPPDRRRILVSATEHKCVLAAARVLAERYGFDVETVPVDREGFVDLNVLKERLDSNVLLVCAMAVNNETGSIQDIPSIAALVQPHGTQIHCDAAQAPCAIELSDMASYTDLMSLSGHKMYGPQGIGILYVRKELQNQLEPLLYGGGQQQGLRSGTVPMPLCIGLGKAAELVSDEHAREERQRVGKLRNEFLTLIKKYSGSIRVNGATGPRRHPGNANVRFIGYDARDILGSLQPRLAASTGAACASGMPEPSHVLRAMGLTEAQCDSSIRFSFGRFSTEEDVHAAAALLRDTLARCPPGL